MARQQPPERFANPVDPSMIGGAMGAQYAILPTLALSPVAAGQSDMLADYYKVTIGSRAEFMEAAEIESPWKLLSGQFDLAFVLVYMFPRSEEHTSELKSLMRISYAAFCLKKQKKKT